MKSFKQHITEAADPQTVIGRNLAAKNRYNTLLKSNPREAQAFIERLKERHETYRALLATLKQAITTHLSRSSTLNITVNSQYYTALTLAARDINTQFPKLKEAHIIKAITRDKHQSTLDITDELVDKLYPDLKGI